MTIQVYKKSEIKIIDPEKSKAPKPVRVPLEKQRKRMKEEQSHLSPSEKAQKITRVISLTLIAVGVSILVFSVSPYVGYYLQKINPLRKEQELITVENDPSVLSLQSRYSPQYFQNVEKNIAAVSEELNTLGDYSDLTGDFYLSIPEIGLDRVPVELNVDSFDKDAYEKVLKNKLSHFRGSSIPGKQGTTFVYGHSTAEWFAKANPNFFGSIFTYLPKVNIGDELIVDYNDKRYRYVVVKVHEVEPSDLSPVFENDGRQLLKLMTCTPVGVGTDRLIVVGEKI